MSDKALMTFFAFFCVGLLVYVIIWSQHMHSAIKYWKQQAIAEARKRLTVDEEQKKIRDAIDTAAANKIVEKDNRIIELERDNKRLSETNQRLWKQIRDLKAGGEFDG